MINDRTWTHTLNNSRFLVSDMSKEHRHLITSSTLINVNPFSCLCVSACLSGSQTVCPAPVARASNAHTLMNVNPFSCLCVRACLPACVTFLVKLGEATRAKSSGKLINFTHTGKVIALYLRFILRHTSVSQTPVPRERPFGT